MSSSEHVHSSTHYRPTSRVGFPGSGAQVNPPEGLFLAAPIKPRRFPYSYRATWKCYIVWQE